MVFNGLISHELNGTPPGDGEDGNGTLKKIIETVVAGIRTLGSVAATIKAGVLEVSTIKVDATGADAIAGKATLVSGTVTVSTTRVKTGSFIQLTPVGVTNAGHVTIGTITNNTSFVINSTSGTDARVVHWEIKEPIA